MANITKSKVQILSDNLNSGITKLGYDADTEMLDIHREENGKHFTARVLLVDHTTAQQRADLKSLVEGVIASVISNSTPDRDEETWSNV